MRQGAVDAEQVITRINSIEVHKDKLVERVEEFFEKRSTRGVQAVPIQRGQFENVLRVAMATRSVREIVNFVRYQIARDKKNENWGKGDFGENLVKEIEAVAKLAPEVKIDLVRLFLGFLGRHAEYVREKVRSK